MIRVGCCECIVYCLLFIVCTGCVFICCFCLCVWCYFYNTIKKLKKKNNNAHQQFLSRWYVYISIAEFDS